jgi:hypothetical protein
MQQGATTIALEKQRLASCCLLTVLVQLLVQMEQLPKGPR